MRTYEHSIAALNLPGSRYQEMMLSQLPLRTLYQSYQMPLYMVVYDSYLNASMAIDMSAIKSDCEYRSITFDQYLIDTAGITLPYLDSLPALDTQYVRYADVFYAGYAINREHPEGYQTATVVNLFRILSLIVLRISSLHVNSLSKQLSGLMVKYLALNQKL